MIDSNLAPTAGALQLAKQNTVAQLRELLQDEFGVKPPSKAIKVEIAQQLDDMRHNAKQAELAAMVAEQGADVDPEVADVAAVDQVITEELGDLAPTLNGLAKGMAEAAEALNTVGLAAQEAARKLAAVAWAHQVAVIKSMGRTVRGKVVDTVLRTPGPDGTGRVLLVVEHPNGARGRKATRTLHALADVQFEALAS